MLEMPRRSVTRFFIPLIDVLTLLFCIFLMMPAVKKVSEAETSEAVSKDKLNQREKALAERERKAAEKEAQLRQDLARVQRETVDKVLKNLTTRVLEIDAASGKLYYRDPDLVEVRSEAEAHRLIERDRDGPGAPHQVHYVILYPRDPNSEYPRKSQRLDYQRWFADVPLSFDIPFAIEAVGGKQP